MDTAGLFKGVAIIIDDEVNSVTANIRNILDQIKKKNIPYITYKSIPSEETISHFQNLSFLLLDWRLIKDDITSADFQDGVSIPQTLRDEEAKENINFLKMLKNVCYCPVFIFSNEDPNEIISKLEDEDVYSRDKPSHIFVKSKSDLKGRTKLFQEIEKWVKGNPSVYVLKEWENEYQQSKNKLFSDFQELSPVWPIIMWNNFGEDGANKSLELGELISRNLHTRMTPFEFSDEVLSKRGKKIDRSEMRRVLEGERFLKESNLHTDEISTGDIFKEEYQDSGITKHRYYLNIRAQCDLVRSSNIDEIELYCLNGRVVEEKKLNKKNGIPFNSGQFIEKVNHAVIPFLDEGCIIEFHFRDLKIKKWKKVKSSRIGRLLPPYINRIQQRYALYLQRQGLPRTPDKAVLKK